MRKNLVGLVALTIVAALAVSGCSSDTSSGTSSEPSASQTPQPGEVIKAYFEAMVAQDGATMTAEAEPASPAADYAAFFTEFTKAATVAERTVTTTDTEATLKRVDDGTEVVYTDFTFAPSGLMLTWTERPGGPLQPRVSAKQKAAKVRPLDVLVQGQYLNPLGELFITLKMTNPSRQKVDVIATDYVSPERVQRGATIGESTQSGAVTMQPRSTIYAYISVEKAGAISGRVGLKTYPSPSGQTLGEVTIKLP